MKNLFLYYYNSNISELKKFKHIYFFENQKLIAIDKDVYGREERLLLQERLYIQPYYISQKILKELILSITSFTDKFRILDINFEEDYIEDTKEYELLLESIRNRDYKYLIEYVNKIIRSYDTEISDLVFVFEDRKFKITSTGILNVEASNEVFTDLLHDKVINRNLLGLCIRYENKKERI